MTTPPIKVLVAEDHELTRIGLRLILQDNCAFEIVGEASNGRSAVEEARSAKPDVILMDIGLPELDGIKATRQIKDFLPATKVIMLTSHDSDEDIFSSFSAGADGYCMKDSGTIQLEMAIKTTASGATWLDPAIASRVLQALPKQPKTVGGTLQTVLSEREREVLEQVVEGCSNNEIAAKLCVSVETVKTHMRHIMEKLGVADRTQAAVKAMRVGIIS